jgi:formylglycine-generating enzyme required for sulfatase activity
LAGRADLDGDGVILAGELVHFIRTQVAQAPLARDRTSPVFAPLPDPRSDARQQRLTIESEFVFASPVGRIGAAAQRRPDAILVARQSQLSATQHVDCADCPVMVRLPPLHPEPARPIALSRTETTYAEWDACYRDLFCTRYLEDGGAGRGDRPASGITWQDQDEFIAWLNFQKARRRPVDGSQRCSRYRLPTPEEWRHAALAGSRSSLPWGARPEPGRAHCRGCGSGFEEGRAAPVGRTTPNRFGLHDMLGNVWEWVAAGGSPCEPERLAKGMCSAGAVMGGGFTTAVDQLAMTMGSVAPSRDGARLDLAGLATPRTVNRLSRTDGLRPHIHPAIGLRPLCELGAP